jgi:hypothetical protein
VCEFWASVETEALWVRYRMGTNITVIIEMTVIMISASTIEKPFSIFINLLLALVLSRIDAKPEPDTR